MTLQGDSGQQRPSAPGHSFLPWTHGRVAYPTSLMEMAPCTVTTEAPSSTTIREMLPLGPRRSWTLKVGAASLQVATNT